MGGRTVVLGVGNSLMRDDGAGVYAIRHLNIAPPPRDDIEFVDGGTLGFTLAATVEAADRLIVIDAAQLRAPAGTVRLFEGEAMDHYLHKSSGRSVHEVGIIDLLAASRLTGTLPARRALIGIQPQETGWGEAPSAPVARAIPEACAAALELIDRWSQS